MPRTLGSRSVAVLALFACFSQLHAAPPADKVKLKLNFSVGESTRRQGQITIKIDAGPEKVTLEQKEISTVTVKEVNADGSVTTLHKTESLEMSVNGEKVPNDDLGEQTIKQASNAKLLSYEEKSTGEEEGDDDHLNERLFQASTIVFSDKAVGVGDKWTIEYDANSKLGTPKAKGEYEVLGFEEVNGSPTVKVKVLYAELEGKTKVTYEATQWIETATGDDIKTEFKVENIPFGSDSEPVNASGVGGSNRLSGTLLKGAQAAPKTASTTTPGQEKPAEKKEEDDIDKKTKDFTKVEGFVTFHHRFKDGRQQIYLELKESQLNKMMMLQSTASTGTGDGRIQAGDPISDQIFMFKKMPNDQIYLVAPNTAVRSTGNPETQRSIDRSFPESYIESLKIEAKQESRKSILLDVTNLFMSDFGLISNLLMGSGVAPDRSKTFVSSVKSFPKNAALETTYVFAGRMAHSYWEGPNFRNDTRGTALKVAWNLFELPENNGYKPRYYDPRVGYFTADYFDFGKDGSIDKNQQMIIRWNLKKKDPKAALSEPVEPIVFWLDNAIPKEWRGAATDAVLMWNKAFEEIGYKNALVVKQMPDNAEFDHADMRYNVIRWVSSPDAGYAVALFRHNPFTGEILNGSITVDSNMVRYVGNEHTVMVDPVQRLRQKSTPQTEMKEKVEAFKKHLARCEVGNHGKVIAETGLSLIESMGVDAAGITKQEFIKEFLREVIAHEVGHNLGLRHNFVASTESSLAELGDPLVTKAKGNAASVMDYLPFNVAALGKKGVSFYSQSVGTYDKWAIAYGYKDISAVDASDELLALRNHASQTNQPGKRYMSDEFADGIDPYVIRFDQSKEPLEYFAKTAEITKKQLMTLDSKFPTQGDTFYSFTRVFNGLFNSHVGALVSASGFIGGFKKNPNFKGDPNEQPPLMPVPADQQRKALNILIDNVLSPGSFGFPKKLYSMFGANSKVSFQDQMMVSYPILPRVEGLQEAVVGFLLSPITLDNLRDQAYRSEGDTLTPAQTMAAVDENVWKELSTGAAPDELRRGIQRAHVQALIDLGIANGSASADVRTMARTNLRSLARKLRSAQVNASGLTKGHYEDLAIRIQKALDAQVISIRP